MNEIKDKIIGILFYEADTLTTVEISEILNLKIEDVVTALEEIKKEYSNPEKSIILLAQNDSYQFVVSGSVRDAIIARDVREREGELSRAALETLTCILYLGSASKSQIDYIRGVQSSYMLRSLASRGLIARSGKSGRDSVYVPTVETLRFMGLSKVEDMPDYEKISNDFKTALQNNNNEIE